MSAAAGGGGLVISSVLTLDKTNLLPGDTLHGTVTYKNTSSSPISLKAIVIAGRPPGGTDAGGPFDDLTPSLGAQTIAAGAMVTLNAARALAWPEQRGTPG